MVKEIEIRDLMGKRMAFFGVNEQNFRIGKYVFAVEEDPSDGYRSYLGSIHLTKDTKLSRRRKKSAIVRIVEPSYGRTRTQNDPVSRIDDGYLLVDKNGHVWLEIGTDNEDTYYPSFVFNYTPKE